MANESNNAVKPKVRKSNKHKIINNSGQGKGIKVPRVVSEHFNWGAFLGTWIWGIGNKTYITLLIFPATLLCIIPFLGLFIYFGIIIMFGIKGNTWAWQNKHFESVRSFHEYQKRWAVIAGIIYGVGAVVSIICMVALFMTSLNALSR